MTDRTDKLQQIVPTGLVLAVAAVVCWISFTAEPSGAFLFPRLISTAMLGLALITFGRAALGLAKPVPGFDRELVWNISAGMVVMLIAVFWAARSLGFYTTAFLSFFLIATIYAPDRGSSAAVWLKRLAISAGFVAVLYALFALLLQVQTPRGILI